MRWSRISKNPFSLGSFYVRYSWVDGRFVFNSLFVKQTFVPHASLPFVWLVLGHEFHHRSWSVCACRCICFLLLGLGQENCKCWIRVTSVTSVKFCNKLVKTKKENKVALFVGSADEILFKWYFCVVLFVSIFRVMFQVMLLTINLVIYGSEGG